MQDFEFNITPAAAYRIKQLISKEDNSNLKFRITVDGGGCSGYQYRYEFTESLGASDIELTAKGPVSILIDEVSRGFLHGARIDFAEDLLGASFKIDNPKATGGCGCGRSFADLRG